jgi:hypothetical protein
MPGTGTLFCEGLAGLSSRTGFVLLTNIRPPAELAVILGFIDTKRRRARNAGCRRLNDQAFIKKGGAE